MELIAVRRVVQQHDVLHSAPDTLHVLHELVIEEGAVLAEQALRGHPLRVEDIHQRVGILGETGCKDGHFIVPADFFDEFLAARPDLHVDVTLTPLDVDREHYISLLRWREC